MEEYLKSAIRLRILAEYRRNDMWWDEGMLKREVAFRFEALMDKLLELLDG